MKLIIALLLLLLMFYMLMPHRLAMLPTPSVLKTTELLLRVYDASVIRDETVASVSNTSVMASTQHVQTMTDGVITRLITMMPMIIIALMSIPMSTQAPASLSLLSHFTKHATHNMESHLRAASMLTLG